MPNDPDRIMDTELRTSDFMADRHRDRFMDKPRTGIIPSYIILCTIFHLNMYNAPRTHMCTRRIATMSLHILYNTYLLYFICKWIKYNCVLVTQVTYLRRQILYIINTFLCVDSVAPDRHTHMRVPIDLGLHWPNKSLFLHSEVRLSYL